MIKVMELIPYYETSFLINTGPYNPKVVEVMRSIDGAKWVAPRKMWSVPRDYLVVKKLIVRMEKNIDGVEVDVDEDTSEWLWEEHERRKKIPPVGRKSKVKLHRVPKVSPVLADAATSRPFQTVGIKFCAYNKSSLLADEPGLGKTIQSIGAMIEADVKGPILVAAPKTAALVTWPEEIKKWSPGDRVTLATGGNKPQRREVIEQFNEELDYDWASNEGAYSARHWIIINFEMLRVKYRLDDRRQFVKVDDILTNNKEADVEYPELLENEWAGIIIDESHKVLVAKSADPKSFTQVRAGIGLLAETEDCIKIAMSGTPQRGKNEKLWGTLNWLQPKVYTSYWKFIDKFFETYKDLYAVSVGDVKDEAKLYKELSGLMIRRTKGEVVKELPPKQYVEINLPMSDKQQKAYNQMVGEAMAELEEGEVSAVGILAEMTRLKQFAGAYGKIEDGMLTSSTPSNKLDWLVEWLDERRDSDSKVIVASQFTRLINMFRDELKNEGWDAHVLTGETPASERARMQKEFQADGGPRVFLLNTNAGGVSLTLDAADDVIILDQTWNPDDQTQVEDRAHRVSRVDHNVTVWNLVSKESIEESIRDKNSEKEFAYKSIIDGQRGVDFAKSILEGVNK